MARPKHTFDSQNLGNLLMTHLVTDGKLPG